MNNWYTSIIIVLLFAVIVSLVRYIEKYDIKPRLQPIPELTEAQYHRYCEIMSKNVMEAYKRGKEDSVSKDYKIKRR